MGHFLATFWVVYLTLAFLCLLTVYFEPDWPGVPRGRQVLGRALVPTLVFFSNALDNQISAFVDSYSGKRKVLLFNRPYENDSYEIFKDN